MAFPISPIKTNAIKSASCQIIHPKFSPSSLNNVAVLGDGHGNQLMRKSYARSRSDMHPPNRVGNRSKHIYAKNILTKHQSPLQGLGKRITDVTKGGTNDNVENLLRHSPQSSSSPALIQQPVQKSVRQEPFGKGKFAYSSDNYYNANTLKRRDSLKSRATITLHPENHGARSLSMIMKLLSTTTSKKGVSEILISLALGRVMFQNMIGGMN